MKLKDIKTINVPIGRSGRVKQEVQRYWYHNLFSRKLKDNGGVAGYPIVPRERELLRMYSKELVEKYNERVIYLSPQPLHTKEALVIDLALLDPMRFRLTGQAEGYAIYLGDIPPEAIGD